MAALGIMLSAAYKNNTMKQIVSSLSTGVQIQLYKKRPSGDGFIKDKSVFIAGGQGVVNKITLVAPDGVITPITDADYELIKDHPVFKRYISRGFMRVVESKNAAEKVKKDLDKNDAGVQLNKEKMKKRNPKVSVEE